MSRPWDNSRIGDAIAAMQQETKRIQPAHVKALMYKLRDEIVADKDHTINELRNEIAYLVNRYVPVVNEDIPSADGNDITLAVIDGDMLMIEYTIDNFSHSLGATLPEGVRLYREVTTP